MKYLYIFILLISLTANAQDPPKKITVSAWEGMFVTGYVDQGAFANFGGPSIKFVQKPFSIGFGLLPSVRIKEDKVVGTAKKNSIVTPTSGFGLTFVYKRLAIQMPMYYNGKTATDDGKWNAGLGIGYKF